MSHNTHFPIAIHILTLLAFNERHLSSAEIANSIETNPVFVRRIVSDLQQAGLVTTIRGVHGGVKLLYAPETITLDQVYDAVVVNPLMVVHQGSPKCLCGDNIQPILRATFDHAEKQLKQDLAQQTIADIQASIRHRIEHTATFA